MDEFVLEADLMLNWKSIGDCDRQTVTITRESGPEEIPVDKTVTQLQITGRALEKMTAKVTRYRPDGTPVDSEELTIELGDLVTELGVQPATDLSYDVLDVRKVPKLPPVLPPDAPADAAAAEAATDIEVNAPVAIAEGEPAAEAPASAA